MSCNNYTGASRRYDPIQELLNQITLVCIALSRTGNYTRAIELYDRALAVDTTLVPQPTEALLSLGTSKELFTG